MNILIIGTGMVVSGHGTDGYGTVMPAVLQWVGSRPKSEIYIAGHRVSSIKEIKRKNEALFKIVSKSSPVHYYPIDEKDDESAYLKALKDIPKPACAIIAVPDHLHFEMASNCIAQGLHTLVVKPLVATLKEAQELLSLQYQHHVYGAVEFHKRYDEANLKLRDYFLEGRVGDPLTINVEFSQKKSIPEKQFKAWVTKTNVFQYLGIHYLDMIYFITHAKPLRVMAVGQKNWLKNQGIDTYDSIEAMVEWKMPSGKRFNSTFLTHWIDPEKSSAMSEQKIKIIGTKGRLESDQKRRGLTVVTDEAGIEEPNPYFSMPYGVPGQVTYSGYGIRSIQQFLTDAEDISAGRITIKEIENQRPSFKEALVSTAALEGVNESLKSQGEWVTIPNVF